MPDGNGKAVALSDVHLPTPAAQRGITGEAWNALKNSVYRGASDAMILLAIDYCKAAKYDPLMKPVHIVKTWDAAAQKEVEGIWPGISLHRTKAARSTLHPYAGQDEPQFGPYVTRKLGDSEFSFPEWCKVTVYRMVNNQRVSYTGLVFFEECYASKKSGGPNAMWRKRPRGQLAKCAEAEALRKAFPEETGGEATAEEMEGAHIGPENAKDVTPAARPASKLDGLEELIGAGNAETKQATDPAAIDQEQGAGGENQAETFDAETGELEIHPMILHAEALAKTQGSVALKNWYGKQSAEVKRIITADAATWAAIKDAAKQADAAAA